MKLENKVAIVTGAASGMGKSIALLYAKEGVKVVVSDLNLDGANKVVEEITSAGGTAFAIKTNVAVEEDIQTLVDTTVSTYGTVDILVNNAGIMDNFEPAADIEDKNWERLFAVNTTSVMRATRKVIPIFLEKTSGVIVNIASAGGLNGARAGATYTASKHAVIGFTKNTGFMYAQQGIRCNAIAPGAVETNISTTITDPHQFGSSRAYVGMATNPRMGKPDEIAQVALFLATEESSFVNGAVIVADGGWSAY
ncbi:MAG TPA: SDR family oxidoreductase [Desulfitobacterium dehalogenans]|uniref:SDR family oxidoreductase n=1 Tax=Desulfitobacterium dehalogenans TaxID=36854 RepID=A0A7C6Z4S8_9FIRM|nr:SDR family oxidoreductase [Desulfitobacterium dehalogenans]